MKEAGTGSGEGRWGGSGRKGEEEGVGEKGRRKGGTWQAIKPATDQWRVGDTCHAACGRARVQMQVCLRSHWATRRGNCLCSAWDNALDSSLHVLKLYKTIYIYRYYIVPPPKTYIHIIASTYRDFLFPLELPNVRLPGVSGDSGN